MPLGIVLYLSVNIYCIHTISCFIENILIGRIDYSYAGAYVQVNSEKSFIKILKKTGYVPY